MSQGSCINVDFDGDDHSGIYTTYTVEDLRRLVGKFKTGNIAILSGSQVFSDTIGSIYTWNPASYAVDNGVTIIASDYYSVGRWVRISVSQNRDRLDLRDFSGVDITGNNDSSAAVQQAVNQAIAEGVDLFVPSGMFTLDNTINVTGPLTIRGTSNAVGKRIAGYRKDQPIGPASRFHITHSGVGLYMGGSGSLETTLFDGVTIRDLLFSNPQPDVVTGQSWTPGNFGPVIQMQTASGLNIHDTTLLNVNRGIDLLGGGGIGRLWTNNLSGQPMVYGVKVELAADVVRMDNTHWWPFWSDTLEVNRWCLNNSDHLISKRNDSMLLSNYFSIAGRSGIRIANSSTGPTSRMFGTNVNIEYSAKGLWFDTTSQNAWASFTNFGSSAAESTNIANTPNIVPRTNVIMEGAGCLLDLNSSELGLASGSAVQLLGSYNRMECSGRTWLQSYGDESGNASAGILVGATNTFVTNSKILNTSPGIGPLVGGAGTVRGIRKSHIPGLVVQSGSPTDLSFLPTDTNFLWSGNNVNVNMALNIGANGAGSSSGYIRLTLPVACDYTFTGSAVDNGTGELLYCVSIPGALSYVQLQRLDGTPVIKNGRTIVVTLNYTIKD